MNPSEIRATYTLGGIFALRMLGLFMIIPIFSIYGRDYTHTTPVLIGLAIGIYGLAQAVLQIPVSMLAERLPRKPIIIVGLLLFALGGAVAAMATDIWQVILGRFLAGAGAISAVVMALLADVTREQTRSKAMAMMGFIIAFSIIAAFSLGPWLVSLVGISGLFWLTSVAGLIGVGLVLLAPSPERTLSFHLAQALQQPTASFRHIFRVPNLNRLYITVFVLHLLITVVFVLVPLQLERFGIRVAAHSLVYLPLLVLGFVCAIPLIIVAEKQRKMRRLIQLGVMLLLAALLILVFSQHLVAVLVVGLGVFFIGFNLLEAIIPSWLSKQAPVAVKNTVMGISASSQFFGAFVGGLLGGYLSTQPVIQAWLLCAVIAVVAVVALWHVGSPPYLTSLTVTLPRLSDDEFADWQQSVHVIAGVEDMVVLADEGVAYLKIDKAQFTAATRQSLSQLIQQPLDF